MLLQIIYLCGTLATTLCDADSAADPQFNRPTYGDAVPQGGYFYQPPHNPPTYGNKVGNCQVKKCTDSISVTHTSFTSTTVVRKYNTISSVTTTALTTSFSVQDNLVTKPVCNKRPTTIINVEFQSVEETRTILECTPTSSEFTFTQYTPFTSTLTINECVPSSTILTVQSIVSSVGEVTGNSVAFDETMQTITQYIPMTQVLNYPVCKDFKHCDNKTIQHTYPSYRPPHY